jgi:arsenate reductase
MHVFFVCFHNAGRSQMAQALFERAAKGDHTATSAGPEPASAVYPEVVTAMWEIGIDLSDRKPQQLTHDLAKDADVVVTMGRQDGARELGY